LMGTPRIEKDGDDVTLPTRKGLALLAYLAMTQVAHSRQTLAALLWPESDTNLALGSLRQTLWQLRKNLKGEWLIADEEKVLLNSSVALWADATRLMETVAACSTHGHEQEEICSECVPLLEEAVALYQGDFLAGYSLQDSAPFDEWHFFQAEEMRRKVAWALQKLVAFHSSVQAYLPAIDYARRWLALDSLYEPAHRALMRLYAESGQQAAAVRQYRLCVDTLHSELGVEPEPETQALYQAIRDGELSGTHGVAAFVPQPQTAQHNLPIQLTPFVGREKELAQLAQLLAGPTCRLLTIVGLGGMGKTHLAIQAAFAQVANFADGVWFVPLASVNDPALLPSHIADLLKMPNMGGGDTESHLLRNLKEKSLLLVLDNFEHLLNAVGLIAHILAEAPGVKLLVTSRERLRLAEEFLLPLRGLSVPAPEEGGQAQVQFDSVELFAQQARQLHPSFAVDSSNAADITQICRLVDGMPLGIKMAAVWLRVLSLPEIVAEIQQSLGFLTTDLRNVPEQHRSMQTVFDSSWRLLGQEEQQLLVRLALFAN
jgi:DNA-binding SARP family transcriptional activator